MVLNQYIKYRKDIADAKNTTQFNHKPQAMPFLPPGIHNIATPPAIKCIQQQDLLSQKYYEKGYSQLYTRSFKRIHGLPYYHTIRHYRECREGLQISHFDDDHWRYQRQQGQPINMPPRPFEHIMDPLPTNPRGRPRRNEASTRRDPSAFERPVPPTFPQNPPQSLTEYLRQISTTQEPTLLLSLFLLMYLLLLPSSISASISITISVSSSSVSSRQSSPGFVNISVTLSPFSRRNREPATQPDTQLAF